MSVDAGPVRVGGHVRTRGAGKAAGGLVGLVAGVAVVLIGAVIFAVPVVLGGVAYTIDYGWKAIRGRGRHRHGYLDGLQLAVSSGAQLGVRLILWAALLGALLFIGDISWGIGGFPGLITGLVIIFALIRWIVKQRA